MGRTAGRGSKKATVPVDPPALAMNSHLSPRALGIEEEVDASVVKKQPAYPVASWCIQYKLQLIVVFH